ncbi:MAG: hypothetical protein AAGB00_12110 [Planctomycetota bacterium]
MQLAILHYHLNRGGVTQAILNHLESLATCPPEERPERVALVFCGRREGWPDATWQKDLPFDCRLIAVPPLDYDSTIGAEPEALAEAIAHGLAEVGFKLTETVLHTHNHALGKNASLPGALARLATRGCRLLLQVHDFAEDSRPANYRRLLRSLRAHSAEELAGTLYPQGSGVHYATLTGRDRGLLSAAGVPVDRLHLLPNPVTEFRDLPSADDARLRLRQGLGLAGDARVVVYPVRGIRRKNVGEMLLHNALAGPEVCYAVTLAPENPVERASFDRWQDLSEKLELGCRFDIGVSGGVRFVDALAGADAMITTSVAEGFGMVFLEAWLAGQPLVGRNLPAITGDFAASGLKYPGLRDRFRVPTAWLQTDLVRRHVLELHTWMCRDFNREPPPETAEELDALLATGSIDFAALPSLSQAEVIGRVAQDREGALEQIAACNEGFGAARHLDAAGQEQLIEANAARVRSEYSPEAVGKRLAAIYRTVMADSPAEEVEPAPAGASILASFLSLDQLCPVRVEA